VLIALKMMQAKLKEKIFAITRSEQDSKEFSQLVSAQGGRTLSLPTIEIKPIGREAVQQFTERLEGKRYDYCAFMSSQAVKVLFDLANKQQITTALRSTAVIAVGPKTKESLEQQGIQVKMLPDKFSSIGLIEMMSRQNPSRKKMIIPRSNAANDFAADALRDLGMRVDEVYLYTLRTCRPTDIWFEFYSLLRLKKINAIVFTSTSTVTAFFDIMNSILKSRDNQGEKVEQQLQLDQIDNITKIISIGPFTSKELEKRKIKSFEAQQHTIKGAFDLAVDLCGSRQ
jgi:uroporphyrinogen-III synthase